MEATPNLLDLVPKRFKPLFPLEEQLIQAAPLGIMVSLFSPDQPIIVEQIGGEETVRSDLLVWLLTTPGVRERIHYKGIHLRGAKITGKLDLQDAKLEFPLRLKKCVIHEGIILERGSFTLLDFSGSHTGAISGDLIHVQHEWLMSDGFHAKGEVRLLSASIGGQLFCRRGTFENPGGYAIIADGLKTASSVYLDHNFIANGEVRLLGANIGEELNCTRGRFENRSGVALFADGLTTAGSVFLSKGFKALGEVRLMGANIGGQLSCIGGSIENVNGIALFADGLTTVGSVLLSDGFKALGQVWLVGANIKRQLIVAAGYSRTRRGLL